jgi:NTP pyrophosphatase (non-canonical NTP hydrolase)
MELISRQDMVNRFMEKYGIKGKTDLKIVDNYDKSRLVNIRIDLLFLATYFKSKAANFTNPHTTIQWRLHLLFNELEELLDAILNKPEHEVSHELADLAYVIEGFAVNMDIPFDRIFLEIHNSNMTKDLTLSDINCATRGKTGSFCKPDIEPIIKLHRQLNNQEKE